MRYQHPTRFCWAWLANKDLRLRISQNQHFMEMADEQLPRGGNPLATVAALVLVLTAAAIAVFVVITFADVIDGQRQIVGTQIDKSTLQIHDERLRK